MYISNGKDKIKYIPNKPTREDKEKYYNTINLDLLIGELFEVRGIEETISFLQNKLKYYKALKKEADVDE